MELHYLEIFYEVAKAKSFTRAAEKLFINQSAVSIQVKKFEESLGATLFDRRTKKIKLTYVGEKLFEMAEEIFEKVKRSEKEINKIIDTNKSRICIGATPIIAEPLLPNFLKRFSSVHPEIEFNITVSNKTHLFQLLKEGDLDIIIIDEEHIVDENLKVIEVQKVPYVLLGDNRYKNMKDVAKAPLISRKHIYNNNRAIAALEDKYQVSFNHILNIDGNLGIIKSMVKQKIANVILPYYAVHNEVENGELNVIEELTDIKDGYQVVITKDKKDLDQVEKFINLLVDHKIY